MSSLTEEQRKKIEENRKKALEKRAAILQKRTINNDITGTLNSKEQTRHFVNKVHPKYWNNDKQEKCCSASINIQSKPSSFYSSNHKHIPVDKKPFGNDVKQAPVFNGKKILGNFTLFSLEQFIVNIPYHAQAIDIFKTMPSRQYDVNTCKWSFNISDHDKLSSSLNSLRPAVCVSALPRYVLQALKKVKNYPKPDTVDLMCLDPLLLEAFMSFQREGVCFGVSRGGRVLIADDMGLGKTIQALGIASYYKNEWPLLIVTPSSVRYSWADAVERWIGDVDAQSVTIVNSTKDELESSIVVMSYDVLSRRAEEVKDRNFEVVIMDESHMLKNFKSVRYKSAAPIMKAARRVILLSGTPALSRPSELYTQLVAVDSKLFPSFQDYGIRYCSGKQQPWGWDYTGSSNMEELQVLLNATVMVRRLKNDVITQLPSKQRMTILLDPASVKSKSKVMQQMKKQLGRTDLKGSERHGALLQMFNETAFAKVNAVYDYIKDLLLEGDKKLLVFAHHKVMMDKVSNLCDDCKIHYIRIDGSTPSDSRQNLVDHFQNSENTRVAVLSITAAGTGLTLTAAQLVVFAELYWNPGPLIQAEDRAHRIGQMDSVLVQYLVAKGTADDYIWPLVQDKLSTLGKAGLSKDNFKEASCALQKTKVDQGILKYFSELKSDDLFESDMDISSALVLSKRRRSSDDDDRE